MRMDNFLNKIKESNDEKIKEMCEMKLKEAYAKYLEGNIENKVYETAGGYRKFQRDIDRLKQDFESDLRDFKDYEVQLKLSASEINCHNMMTFLLFLYYTPTTKCGGGL
jgi:hypothetical protein